MAQRRRGALRQADQAPAQAGHVRLARRAAGRDQALPRRDQRRPKTLRLDRPAGAHPREGPPRNPGVRRNPLGTLRARRDALVLPTVDRHRGRVVKEMGDGFLVEFASAVAAVRCAMELQHLMAEANAAIDEERAIVLRIGINLGDVAVDDADIQGDGVNIAARLEAIADPGSICISGSMFEQVERQMSVAWKDLGARELKNIARPIRVYRVTSRAKASPGGTSAQRPAAPSIAVLPFTNMSGDPEQDYFTDGVTEDIITELSR